MRRCSRTSRLALSIKWDIIIIIRKDSCFHLQSRRSFSRAVHSPLEAITFSMVADGGPAEQGAIPILMQDTLTNVSHIGRDRSHRAQSVMKGLFSGLNDMCQNLLSVFTVGEKSFSRMLKTSGGKKS